MKKKPLKKWQKVRNSFYLLFAILLVSSCGKLGIEESDFNQSNRSEFILDFNQDGLDEMPIEAVRKLLSTTGETDTNIEYSLESMWFYYSWESTDDLTVFTILQSSDCDEYLHLYTFSGSKFISQKIIASRSSCGDFEEMITSTKTGNRLSLANYSYGYGDIFSNESTQECAILPDGNLDCEEVINQYPGVSLWNSLALRETPNKKGKFIAHVNMGETFTTSDSVEWSADDEYLYIQLQGGTSGYILNELVIRKAVPLVILADAAVYRRPDELTKTADTFYKMDVVGYSEMGGDFQWLKVKGKPKGEKWFKEGWIKSENVTQNPADIAVASLVSKALEEKDLTKRYVLLDAIRSNDDFASSSLIADVNKMLEGPL